LSIGLVVLLFIPSKPIKST